MVSFITILSSLSLIGGGIGYFVYPVGVSFIIKKVINLAENGFVYPLYMKPPFATRSEFNLFEVVNPREVLRGGKMKFRLKGPYYYATRLERDNVIFLNSGQKMQYDSHRKLYSQEDISANFDEEMWLINPVVPGVVKTVKSMILDRIPFQRLAEPVVMNVVNALLDNFKERLITRTTPRMYLDGRKVELQQTLVDLAARFGLSSFVPPGPPQNTFGLAFVQNETVDQLEIYTGVGETAEKFGEVTRWKGKQKVEAWRGRCSVIAGTNGELYKPFVDTKRPIRVFLSPLCRSFLIVPTGNGSYKTTQGLTAWQFQLNPKLFAGVRTEPRNKCFCEDLRTYDCQLDGLMPMGPCFFNTPLFFTRTNLEGVDKRIRETTDFDEKITQNKSTKRIFSLDQTTGTVLGANLTLMAVVKIVRHRNFRDLERVINLTYAPFFMTTESFELPFESGWQIYMLQQMNNYYKPAMLGTAGIGALTLSFRWLFGL